MSKLRIDNPEQLARMFKALSNPHRLSIFMRLASCCPPGTRACTVEDVRACVGDLGKDLGIAPSTVSHHIKELVGAGLIQTQRRGQSIDCWVEPDTLRTLAEFFTIPAPPGPSKEKT